MNCKTIACVHVRYSEIHSLSDRCFNVVCAYLFEHKDNFNLSPFDLVRLVTAPMARKSSELYIYNLLRNLSVYFIEIVRRFDKGDDMYFVRVSYCNKGFVKVS